MDRSFGKEEKARYIMVQRLITIAKAHRTRTISYEASYIAAGTIPIIIKLGKLELYRMSGK